MADKKSSNTIFGKTLIPTDRAGCFHPHKKKEAQQKPLFLFSNNNHFSNPSK